MKRITWFMSCLLLMLVALQAKAAVVYVETDDPTFNVYTWSPETFGGWPGSLITDKAELTEVNGKQYYKFSLDGTGRFIIFNKGGVQTQNIPLVDGDNYFTYPIDGDYSKYETTNPPIVITSYTIVGVAELCGQEWAPGLEANDMELQDDGSYQLVREGLTLEAGGYDYKVVGNHAWGLFEVPQSGNQTLTIAEDGKYNVTFTLKLGEENILTAEATEVEPVVIDHTYTVTGEEDLMGVSWDLNAVENEMTKIEDGVYTLVKDNLDLNARSYEYKVVRDHSWSWAVPQTGNYSLNIEERGKYKVTFKLTLGETPTLTAVAEKLEEPPVPITSYTIVGDAALTGADWDVNAEANEMTQESQGVYVLLKENVQLTAGNYNYKVVGNHSYDVYQLPLQGNNTLEIAADGKYNVTFKLTLGEEGDNLTASAEKIEEPPVPITSYTIVGDAALTGVDWDVNAEANEMSAQEDGSYKLVKSEVELAPNNYEYKVVGNHSYEAFQLPLQGNQILEIATNGKYNVTFILTLGETPVLTATAELVQEILPDYVLHYGTQGAEWQDKVFIPGEGENEGKLVAADVEFATDTEFGIKYGDTWYAGIPNNDEPHYRIHGDWCTDIPLCTGDDVKNFIIKEAGTYTFILTIGEEGNTLTVTGFPITPTVVGDLNADNLVDVSDVNIMVNMILGISEKTDAADLDHSGDVDVSDVNILVNIILGR